MAKKPTLSNELSVHPVTQLLEAARQSYVSEHVRLSASLHEYRLALKILVDAASDGDKGKITRAIENANDVMDRAYANGVAA